MSFLEAVEIYFRGERLTGLAIIPIGIAMMVLGIYLWRWTGGALSKGFGIPIAIAGLAAAIGGGFLANTVNKRQTRLTNASAESSEGPRAEERERMAQVNRSWKLLKGAWVSLGALGLVLLVVVTREWVQGIALALVCLIALALVVDVYAEKRALLYADRLGPPPQSPAPDSR